MADLEEDIESLVRRNEVVDEEFQGMKTDIASLSDKILAIKVSSSVFSKTDFIWVLNSISRNFDLGKHKWDNHFRRHLPRILSIWLPAKWNVLRST